VRAAGDGEGFIKFTRLAGQDKPGRMRSGGLVNDLQADLPTYRTCKLAALTTLPRSNLNHGGLSQFGRTNTFGLRGH
jgi:hypothetical protein